MATRSRCWVSALPEAAPSVPARRQPSCGNRANRGQEKKAKKMTTTNRISELANREYKWGFVTLIESETVPPGLNEEIIRVISAKKGEPEFMLEWRLKAYRHWLTMTEPRWAKVHYPPIDYQSIIYYSAP